MAKIVVNSKVRDLYTNGVSLNDAIRSTFKEEIEDRIAKNEAFKDFKPLDMVLYDAGINKYSTMEKLMNTAN